MKIKCIVIFLFMPFLVFAQNLQLTFENHFLEAPSFINISSANFFLLGQDQRGIEGNHSLEFQFRGRNLEVWATKTISFFVNCSENEVKCDLTKVVLPPHLDRLTCSLKSTLKKSNGIIIATNLSNWGQCDYSEFNSHPVWDYFVAENVLVDEIDNQPIFPYPLPDLVQTRFTISGASNKTLKHLLVGFDKNQKIIFHQTLTTTQASLSSLFTPYQWQNLCKLNVYLDSSFSVNEINKLNNEKTFELGECSNGERPDLAAWINRQEDKLVLYFINLGSLGITGQLTQFNIYSFDSNNNRLNSTTRSLEISLDGLGGFKTFNYPIINPIACRFIFEVDPSYNLSTDINRTNNIFELNLCH